MCTEPLSSNTSRQNKLLVGVSTSDNIDVAFNIAAYPIKDFSARYFYLKVNYTNCFITQRKFLFCFRLNHNYSIEVTPSEPKYYQFTFPDYVNNVLLVLQSDDLICMTVAIHNLSVYSNRLYITPFFKMEC